MFFSEMTQTSCYDFSHVMLWVSLHTEISQSFSDILFHRWWNLPIVECNINFISLHLSASESLSLSGMLSLAFSSLWLLLPCRAELIFFDLLAAVKDLTYISCFQGGGGGCSRPSPLVYSWFSVTSSSAPPRPPRSCFPWSFSFILLAPVHLSFALFYSNKGWWTVSSCPVLCFTEVLDLPATVVHDVYKHGVWWPFTLSYVLNFL